MKIVIFGGGAGGASVAARARRLDAHAQIILVDKRADVSASSCALPDHLSEPVHERRRLIVLSPEDFARCLNVEVRDRSEVVQIARHEKTVTIQDLCNGRHYTESYDQLVLATGSTPIVPPITGIHRPHVLTLQSLDELDGVKHYLKLHPCRHVVVVGAGFVGLEAADHLQQTGIHVRLVEKTRQALGALDFDMATLVHQQLRARGIELLLEKEIREITKDQVILTDGETLPAELIVLAVGVRPTTLLASRSGIKLGALGGISVNEQLRTSDEHIYALGDAIEVDDGIGCGKTLLPPAKPTHRQAAVIAENLFGGQHVFRAGPGTAKAKCCNLTVARTGLSEKQLQTRPIEFGKSCVALPRHTHNEPGMSTINLKLLFSKENGRLLGAQIVAAQGTDRLLDDIATAIQFGKSVYDLAEQDPDFVPSTAAGKDPVHVANVVAETMLRAYSETAISDTPATEEYVQHATPVGTSGEDRFVFADSISLEIDATGISCPEPLVRLNHGIKSINDGQYLLITASDPVFEKDIETWCRRTGHALHSRVRSQSVTKAVIRKDTSSRTKNK
jgi:NADPH-dependent 2,4-dienoyl-CoA reductase/sulfur reductase-like enzyme/TusA-related sulfurtransferase